MKHVIVLIDESGSMALRVDETLEAVNGYIRTLPEDIKLSLYTFDHSPPNPTIRSIFKNQEVKSVPEFSADNYKPRGSTPLFDAMGQCVHEVERFIQPDDKVLFVVDTDGLENASREYNRDSINALIKMKESDDWSFVYLAIGPEAWNPQNLSAFQGTRSAGYSGQSVSRIQAYAATAQSTQVWASGEEYKSKLKGDD